MSLDVEKGDFPGVGAQAPTFLFGVAVWLQNMLFTSDTVAGSEPLDMDSVWFCLFSMPYECLFFQALLPFSPVSDIVGE